MCRFALSGDNRRQFQLRYVFTVSCGVALIDKLDIFYAISPVLLDREGFRRLLRSFKLITTTILHYTIFSSLILVVCAINMTKFVGQNPKFLYTATGECTGNAELWKSLGWSLLSLFQVSTMDWGDICRAIIKEAPMLVTPAQPLNTTHASQTMSHPPIHPKHFLTPDNFSQAPLAVLFLLYMGNPFTLHPKL